MTPTLGSIVQKGKFAACALALDRQLNNVDLPTLGSPTIPHFNAIFFYKRLFSGAKLLNKLQKLRNLQYIFIYPQLFVTLHRQIGKAELKRE
jgi:hypothetical protein